MHVRLSISITNQKIRIILARSVPGLTRIVKFFYKYVNVYASLPCGKMPLVVFKKHTHTHTNAQKTEEMNEASFLS